MLSCAAGLSTNIWCKLGQCCVKTQSYFAASLSCTISLHTHCVKAITSNSLTASISESSGRQYSFYASMWPKKCWRVIVLPENVLLLLSVLKIQQIYATISFWSKLLMPITSYAFCFPYQLKGAQNLERWLPRGRTYCQHDHFPHKRNQGHQIPFSTTCKSYFQGFTLDIHMC